MANRGLAVLLQMATEGVPHSGEQPIGEVGFSTRGEAFVERRRENRRRRRFINRCLDGPAAFTGVRNMAGEFRQVGLFE